MPASVTHTEKLMILGKCLRQNEPEPTGKKQQQQQNTRSIYRCFLRARGNVIFCCSCCCCYVCAFGRRLLVVAGSPLPTVQRSPAVSSVLPSLVFIHIYIYVSAGMTVHIYMPVVSTSCTMLLGPPKMASSPSARPSLLGYLTDV